MTTNLFDHFTMMGRRIIWFLGRSIEKQNHIRQGFTANAMTCDGLED